MAWDIQTKQSRNKYNILEVTHIDAKMWLLLLLFVRSRWV